MPEHTRRSISARALALYSAALAAVLAAGAFVAYRELLHYERRALLHVPEGATFAARADLEQLVVFEPIRKHLIPLVDRLPLGRGPDAGPAPASRLTRLRQDAGLNLGLDLRELLFARLPDGGWVLVAGGLFPGGDLLERVAEVLRAEPGSEVQRDGALLVLGPARLALAQASDGVLVLGSVAAVQASLHAGDAHRALGLPAEGAASLARVAAAPPDALRRVSGRLELGEPFELALELESTPGALARDVIGRWLGVDESLAPAADWGGERAVLARATFTTVTPTLTRMRSTLTRAELDRACRSLAAWLEARAAPHGPSAR